MAPWLHSCRNRSAGLSTVCLQMSCCCYWKRAPGLREDWRGRGRRVELRQFDPGGGGRRWIDGTAVKFVAARERQQLDEHRRVSPPEGFNAQPRWRGWQVCQHTRSHTPAGPVTTMWGSRYETFPASSTHCLGCSSVKQAVTALKSPCLPPLESARLVGSFDTDQQRLPSWASGLGACWTVSLRSGWWWCNESRLCGSRGSTKEGSVGQADGQGRRRPSASFARQRFPLAETSGRPTQWGGRNSRAAHQNTNEVIT